MRVRGGRAVCCLLVGSWGLLDVDGVLVLPRMGEPQLNLFTPPLSSSTPPVGRRSSVACCAVNAARQVKRESAYIDIQAATQRVAELMLLAGGKTWPVAGQVGYLGWGARKCRTNRQSVHIPPCPRWRRSQ